MRSLLRPASLALLVALALHCGAPPAPHPPAAAPSAQTLARRFPGAASLLAKVGASSGASRFSWREDGFSLDLPSGERMRIRHAQPVAAEESSGMRVTRGAFFGVDTFSFFVGDGLEELLLFSGEGGEASYEVELPRGYRLRPWGEHGVVEVVDEGGRAQARVKAPEAWDEGGRRGNPRVEVRGNRVVVRPFAAAKGSVLVDPAWEGTLTPLFARKLPTLTTLADGRVLIAGGEAPEGGTAIPDLLEVFDPLRGTFTLAGKMQVPRRGHGAFLRGDGKVALVGGLPVSVPLEGGEAGWGWMPAMEVFDPREPEASRAVKVEGEAPELAYVPGPMVALPGGEVLLLSGERGAAGVKEATHAYRLKLESGEAKEAGSIGGGRACAAGELLGDGRVLVVGGRDGEGKQLTSSLWFDPQGATWSGGPKANELVSFCPGESGWTRALRVPQGFLLPASSKETDFDGFLLFDEDQGKFYQLKTVAQINAISHITQPEITPSGRIFGASDPLSGADFSLFNMSQEGEKSSYKVDAKSFELGYDIGGNIFESIFLPSGKMLLVGSSSGLAKLPVLSEGGYQGAFTNLGHVFPVIESARTSPGLVPSPSGDDTRYTTHGSNAAISRKNDSVLIVHNEGTSGSSLLTTTTDSLKILDGKGSNGTFLYPFEDGSWLRVGRGSYFYPGIVEKISQDGSLQNAIQIPESDLPQFKSYPRDFYLHKQSLISLPPFDTFPYPEEKIPTYLHNLLKNSLIKIDEDPARGQGTPVSIGEGKILLVGGSSGASSLTSMRLDLNAPSPKLEPLPGVLAIPRGTGHAVARLPDGRLLVSGGYASYHSTPPNSILKPFRRAELEVMDPSTGQGSLLPFSLTRPRAFHRTLVLPSGKVLVAGGERENNQPKEQIDVELLDLEANSSQKIATLPDTTSLLTMEWLPSEQKVLLLVRQRPNPLPSDSREFLRPYRFDPVTEKISRWSSGLPSLAPGFSLTRLPSGKMLLLGPDAQILDPDSGARSPAGPLATPRTFHTASLLSSGKVLVAGGRGTGGEVLASMELYDPESNTFSPAGSMAEARAEHAAVSVGTEQVWLLGGTKASAVACQGSKACDAGALDSIEVVGGAGDGGGRKLKAARRGAKGTVLGDGQLLIAGGGEGLSGAELLDPRTGEGRLLPVPSSEAVRVLTTTTGEGLISLPSLFVRVPLQGEPRQITLSLSEELPVRARELFTPLVSGDIAACGLLDCTRVDQGSDLILRDSRFPRSFSFGLGERNPQGGYTLVYPPQDDEPEPLIHSFSPVPSSAPRPSLLASGPVRFTSGAPFTLAGARLARMAIAGAENLPPRPDVHPLVVWMPESGGGPIFADVLSWSDTSVTFRLAPTVAVGPGFLHPVVGGVFGPGVFAVLEPSPQGQACQRDAECGSGFCTDGVCCDQGCQGACLACTGEKKGQGEDGVCGPLVAEKEDPRCGKAAEGTCGATGVCGENGVCALNDGASCGEEGKCKAGGCQLPGGLACESNRDCPAEQECAGGKCAERGKADEARDPGGCSAAEGKGSGAGWGLVGLAMMAGILRRRRGRIPSSTEQGNEGIPRWHEV